jgi:undecaprenyl-diphosphatase
MTIFQSIILAIVEGITEFLPISSTGHMIICSSLMGIGSDHFVKMFTVAIQFGAVLSVIVLYWRKFIQSFDFYLKLFIAFLPAAVIGKLLHHQIDRLLENVVVVGISLLVGGIIFLFIDKLLDRARTPNDKMTNRKAFTIVIALVPGVSRSAATIIGGLTQNLSRKAAAEFSFFLAVPTMFAATVYKLYEYHKEYGLHKEDLGILALGNVIAFVVALFAIKVFIAFLTKNGFKVFGWYRIVVGATILIVTLLGYHMQIL